MANLINKEMTKCLNDKTFEIITVLIICIIICIFLTYFNVLFISVICNYNVKIEFIYINLI